MKVLINILSVLLFLFNISTCLIAQESEMKLVSMPYQRLDSKHIAGNVEVIDAEKEYSRDSRTTLWSAIEGKVSGSIGGMNLNGLGDAFTVIDGIPMGIGFLNLRDVAQIVVLKDASSRLLYGVETDVPIVLITTKKGTANKRILQFSTEHGIKQALAYPKFLDAASYMEAYNKAYRNGGATNDYYSLDAIQKTRSGADPVLFPNNNYYSRDYVNNFSNTTNMYGTVSGGNEKLQYLLQLDWLSNPGWNKINNIINNTFSVRARVDFEVNKWLKMNSQVFAAYDLTNGPNMGSYWSQANTLLPNAYPELIPTNRISNIDSLANYTLINGSNLLGGTSIYQNTLYGDLRSSGSSSQMKRYVQSRLGFDINLAGITKGLSVHGVVGYDFYNVYKQIIDDRYSVYEIGNIYANNTFSVKQIGVDKTTSQQTINYSDMSFNRTVKWNYSANYERNFGIHELSAVALGYGSFYTQNDQNQSPRKLAFGGKASYKLSSKYLIDLSLLSQASMKVKASNRFGYSKSVGAAWIVSNEDFLRESSVIDFLKLRASYGHLVSDAFVNGKYNGYFLNENLFTKSYVFLYNNGFASNTQELIEGFDNQLDWEKRNEISIGMDMAILKNKLWIDATFFNSYSYDNVTSVEAFSPVTLGGISTFKNFNATEYNGFNFGLKYCEKLGDLQTEIGFYYSICNGVTRKIAENIYNIATNKHLSRLNTDTRGLWGLTAERLYVASDFDANSNLLAGVPTPAWGQVKAGDIKYLDYNKDGVVNDDDVSIIGRNMNNIQMSLNIDLKYNQWELFLLPILQMGGNGIKNSTYYWFKGSSAKFSEVALEAFDEANPDPQATYPRLSLGGSSNNYRNSTFWIYDKSNFQLVTAQLSYNFELNRKSLLQNIKLYAKANNVLMIAHDLDVLQLNFGTAPQSRNVSLGATLTF